MKAKHYSPLELFDHLGPSARACIESSQVGEPFKKTGNPRVDFKRHLTPETLFKNADKFLEALSGEPIPESAQLNQFNRFFFATPTDEPKPNLGNPTFTYKIPTSFLESMLMDFARTKTLEEQITFASKFMLYPQVAGILYEAVVVTTLELSDKPLDCVLANGSHFQLQLPLVVPTEVADFNRLFTPNDGVLYIPPKDFPSIDAVAVTEGAQRITLLQMTIASRHAINVTGIKRVVDTFESTTSNLKWAFIFVVPSRKIGEGLIKSATVEIAKRTRSSVPAIREMDVGWAVVPNMNERLRSL